VKLGEDVITLLGTQYDYGSVMHYGAYGFAIDPTVPTIITLDEDAEIGQRITLSAIDIERVQIHYECLDPVIRITRMSLQGRCHGTLPVSDALYGDVCNIF